MVFSSLNIDADGSQKMPDFGKQPNQGIFRGRPSRTKARCFPPDYVEAPKAIKVTIGIRGLNLKATNFIFKLRDEFEYKIHGSRGVVVTSMMWYRYTAPFSGNFRFASCFFFIKISAFLCRVCFLCEPSRSADGVTEKVLLLTLQSSFSPRSPLLGVLLQPEGQKYRLRKESRALLFLQLQLSS